MNTKNHHRKSIRFKKYDYSEIGAYNRRGAYREHNDNIFVGATNRGDASVEHIVNISLSATLRRGVLQYAPTNRKLNSPTQTVGSIVRGFKSAVTTQINTLRSSPGKPFWQRNYYEHIIGGEHELNEIRAYIYDNPLKWEFDSENPKKQNGRPTGSPLQNKTLNPKLVGENNRRGVLQYAPTKRNQPEVKYDIHY